jgi:hypothetical protein
MPFLRTILVVLTLLLLPVLSFAQTDGDADATTAPPPTDEYNNVPPGLLAPPDIGMPKPVNPNAVEFDPEERETEATTLDELLKAYGTGKYDVAFKHMPTFAQNGSHIAEEILGVMYHNGQGTPKDPDKAVIWLTKAADAGRPLAEHHLATMAFLGEGMPQDSVKALMWLHLAVLHYPDGLEKNRAIEDRNNLYTQMTRRNKDRAVSLAREWLEKRGESASLSLLQTQTQDDTPKPAPQPTPPVQQQQPAPPAPQQQPAPAPVTTPAPAPSVPAQPAPVQQPAQPQANSPAPSGIPDKPAPGQMPVEP